MDAQLALAAVVFEPGASADAVIASALEPFDSAELLGWLQWHETDAGCDCHDIVLRPLQGGSARKITQDLGPGATGCRLDSSALTEVAGWLMAGLEAGPRLVVLNRFGKAEAEGGGLRGVLEQAIGQGIPVLLAVNRRQLGFWREFAGDLAQELPCDSQAIRTWVSGVLAQPCSMVKTVA